MAGRVFAYPSIKILDYLKNKKTIEVKRITIMVFRNFIYGNKSPLG